MLLSLSILSSLLVHLIPCPDPVLAESAAVRETLAWRQWRGDYDWAYDRPELTRFPTAAEANDALIRNQDFRDWARDRSFLYTENPAYWLAAVQDSDARRRAWYHLGRAWACPYKDEAEHLETLHGILGEEDFWKGAMPSPIPTKYLERLD